MVKPSGPGNFQDQLKAIERAYKDILRVERINRESVVFKRFFVSDLVNQAEILESSPFSASHNEENLCAVFYIEQPPLPSNKVALWVYHIKDSCESLLKTNHVTDLAVIRNGYKHIWSSGLSDTDPSAYNQTEAIFKGYGDTLEKMNLNLKTHVIRTWLYVQNIDTNYNDVVVARREFFDKNGLTKQTHYITSTGIEGRYKNPKVKVVMDAYAVDGITEEQIKFLKAPANLNPTHEYGVTFERGTSVDYGDRRHIFIAGTASINNKGEILHAGDINKQLERAMENIRALLAEAEAGLDDVAQFTVYLRDIGDYPEIQKYFDKHYTAVPRVILLAPVCRPGWLVEVECMAIKQITNKMLNKF
jgi:enamine deaminase RidA (YjgF/YER057c/UK114 family)